MKEETMIDPSLTPGLKVTWIHVPPGGYGYTIKIPATVIRAGGKLVLIEARKQNGDTVRRRVRASSLRWAWPNYI